MNEVSIEELMLGTPLDFYLFHKSGMILHQPGDILTSVHIALLGECAIKTLIKMENVTDPSKITYELSKKNVTLDSIPLNEPVSAELFDKSGNSILSAGELLTDNRKQLLKESGMTEFYYHRDAMELHTFQGEKYCEILKSDKFECFDVLPVEKKEDENDSVANSVEEDIDTGVLSKDVIPDDRFLSNPFKMVSSKACKELMLHPEMLVIPPYDQPNTMEPKKIIEGRTRETANNFNRQYREWTSSLESLFSTLKSGGEVSYESIDEIGSGIIQLFFADVFYCCNLINLRQPPASERYLPTHCLNVAILTVGVGATLGYPLWILRELVFGALLHDIGHQLTYRPYLSQEKLSSVEQKKFDDHSIVGIAMLKNISRVPISTMMIVAQHHEKIDNSGRIFHATADKIHEFAKIIGAIDSFETRCRFMTASAALATVVALAQKGSIELKYAKALVVLLSLFPIGTSVKTNNGFVCKIVGTNRNAFLKPILKSLYTMQDGHIFEIDTHKLIDMKKTPITINREITHSALNRNIAVGFYDT